MARVGNLIAGRYRLESEIGQGSMGSVWKAVHETLGRPFAVKFLKHYGMDGGRLQERFLREARLAAAVSHRFVVGMVDFGMTEEATPYIVMEYLEGESLSKRLRRPPPLRVRDLARLIAETLLGLEAVHQAGVVHRDMKPDNIILVPEAGGAIPKVVDFSISRPEAPGASSPHTPTPLTIPGTTVGTPWYMSPEQASGSAPVDRRTDIYSVGVILYEALTGGVPFDGPDVDTVLIAVAGGNAPSLESRRPDLGPALAAIVDRAMYVAPEGRFQTAAEMAAALVSVMQKLPEDLTCPDSDDAHPFGRPSTATLVGPPAGDGGALELDAAPVTALVPARPVAAASSTLRTQRRRGRVRQVTTAFAVLAAVAVVITLAGQRFTARATFDARAAGAAERAAASRSPSLEHVAVTPPGPGRVLSEPAATGEDHAAAPTAAEEPPVTARPALRAGRRADKAGRAGAPDVFRHPGF